MIFHRPLLLDPDNTGVRKRFLLLYSGKKQSPVFVDNKMYAPRTFYYHELGFWCQKVAHNLAIVKLHKVGTRFVTLGEN